ncbi:MAG: DUF2177 family protein, partial [Alphaproteobacteria bacterium]
LAFYCVYVVGVVVFAVQPALQSGEWVTALSYGALLGLVAYGTYDFTNLSTLKDWPWQVSAVDIVWGTSLTALSAVLGFFASRAILP